MITYKLYQNNRSNNPNKGKWYARAIHTQTVETKDMAKVIQRNCTLKKSDIVAVISELVDIMQDELQSGKRVKLNGIGTFKISLKSIGADEASDFKASKHIVGSRVNFLPEYTVDGSRARHTTFTDGIQFRETPKNDVDTSKSTNADEQTNNGD